MLAISDGIFGPRFKSTTFEFSVVAGVADVSSVVTGPGIAAEECSRGLTSDSVSVSIQLGVD
jgi:hypothetical protein